MADRMQVGAMLAYLGSAVGKVPTAEQAEVYFDLLGDLPADVLMAAAKRAATEHEIATIPPAGMIRRHARDLQHPPLPAAQAWELVCAAARRYGLDGEGRAIRTLPPPVADAARAYGWRAICDSRPGDSTVFAQFRGVYESLSGAGRLELAMPPAVRLPGAAGAIAGAIGRMPGDGPKELGA